MVWLVWFQCRFCSRSSTLAVNAFGATTTAAASAGLTWMFLMLSKEKPSVLGFVSVHRFSCDPPAAGYVGILKSIIVGFVGALFQILP
jgi:Amt family ammonium transporter